MSAYVNGRPHINALVRLALEGPTGVPVSPGHTWHAPYFGDQPMTPDRADELGRALIAENVRSVNYRYSERASKADREYRDTYQYFGGRRLTVPEALLALQGFDYQSCEHPGWVRSEVYRFVNELRARVASRVPGYDDADTWEVTSDV